MNTLFCFERKAVWSRDWALLYQLIARVEVACTAHARLSQEHVVLGRCFMCRTTNKNIPLAVVSEILKNSVFAFDKHRVLHCAVK